MKQVIAATCVAVAGAVGLAAQQTGTQAEKQGSSMSAGQKSVTVTGCLRAGDAPGTYTLANVKSGMAGEKSGMAGGEKSGAGMDKSGAMASGSKMGAGTTLRLVGSPAGQDLTKHVGHTVQLTGSYGQGAGMSGSGAMSGSGKGAGAGGTAAGKTTPTDKATPTVPGAGGRDTASAGGMRTFNVTAMKHISATCDEAK